MTREKPLYPWGQPISSWDEIRAEIEGEARLKRGRPTEEDKLLDRNQDKPTQEEDSEELAVVMGSGFEI